MLVKHDMKIFYASLVSHERLMAYVHEIVNKKTKLHVYIIPQQKSVPKVHVKVSKKTNLHVHTIPKFTYFPKTQHIIS